MKAELLKNENNEAEFSIEFSAEEFDAALDAVYRRNRGRFTVDGFRKGKAPRNIIEARYGSGIFFEDAVNDLLQKGYYESIKDLQIEVVGEPEISLGDEIIEQHKGFAVTAKVAVEPEPELKDYLGIEVERVVHRVTDEMLDRELETLRVRNSRLVSANRPAEIDDTVFMDYSGFIGGEQFEGGTAENQQLKLGSGTFIPGFEDQLVGISAGEEREVTLNFPEDYHAEDLAGKEATFKCKVHDVKETELPETDDEFAKDVSEFDSIDELKDDIRTRLEKGAEEATKHNAQNAVLEKLLELNPFDVPQVMIDREAGNMYNGMARDMSYQGISIEDYCKYLDKTPENILEEIKPEAEKKAKVRLLVKAVGKAAEIEVTEEDVDAELKELADMYRMDSEKVKTEIGDGGMQLLKEDVLFRKTVDFLYGNAKFKDKEPEPRKSKPV